VGIPRDREERLSFPCRWRINGSSKNQQCVGVITRTSQNVIPFINGELPENAEGSFPIISESSRRKSENMCFP